MTKRLVPYVELTARHRPGLIRPSPEISSSPPRKRRRIPNRDLDLENESVGDTNSQLIETEEVGVPNTTASQSSVSSPSAVSFQQEAELESTWTCITVPEDEDIVIQGESPLDKDERDAGDVPIRLLEDYVIYDVDSFEAVPLTRLLEILHSESVFSASGIVKPWIEEDSDDEDSSTDSENEDDRSRISAEPQCDRLSLTEIREFSVHSPRNRRGELDEKMYIRTDFAWYILGLPSRQYVSLFRPFWLQHRVVHLLVHASTDQTRLTYQTFKDNIQQFDEAHGGIVPTSFILGRNLRTGDIESPEVVAYVRSTLSELHQNRSIQISRVAAIREILGQVHYKFDTDIPKQVPRTNVRLKNQPPRKLSIPSHGKKVKPANKTFLTPVVNLIAKDLFRGSLEVSKIDHYDEEVMSVRRRQHKTHNLNPAKITWGKRLIAEEVYGSVIVDGVVYKMGDIVMVEPDGSDQTKTSIASQTVNKYGNRWFCQIRYFFQESGGQKMFHGQWFVHGCKTILQETSHSKALYLLKKGCDTNPISSIFQKCNITILRHDDDEVADDLEREANDFHCGLMYDDDLTSFEDLPLEALSVDDNWGHKSCYSCSLKEKENSSKVICMSGAEEVMVYGETYHVHDVVYLHPLGSGQVLSIGQIMEITMKKDVISVQVRLFQRYDEFVHEQQRIVSELEDHLTLDERRLFYTDDIKIIPAHKIERKCHVRHLTDEEKIEDWIEHDDHFYFNQVGTRPCLTPMKKRDFGYCAECRAEDDSCRAQNNRFLASNSKMVGMELFSGAGGLGVGMDLSRFVETRYAVEYEPSAAKTYKKNHPDTVVYCQDSSALLKHAVAVVNYEDPPPLKSNDGQSLCPLMPKQTDRIDFIFGGPPCQSFSKANHSKRSDDIRSTMSCNMLSYVEHYQPSYFLLENVAGFLEHNIESTHFNSNENCTIRFGMVKFVTRTLIALGYQVRYRLLQAGQYGVPQSRSRVIFWGAKRGLSLPDFPIPVYAFPKGATKVTLPTEGKLEPITRSKNPDEYHHFAPLKAITVANAISDLMPFEWINPHLVSPARSRDLDEAKRRSDLGIFQFDADIKTGNKEFKHLPGFPEGVVYAKKPQNRYQKWLRREMNNDSNKPLMKVTGHYTTRWKQQIIEATANVPLRALADHRDLDDIFLSERAKVRRPGNKMVFYGRLDSEEYFKCAMTTLSPVVKNQWPLHPTLKRVISVREAARAQGFPDTYIFESINTEARGIVRDQLKQIGNAVAVPFALALGKELGKALVKDWEKKRREGSVSL